MTEWINYDLHDWIKDGYYYDNYDGYEEMIGCIIIISQILRRIGAPCESLLEGHQYYYLILHVF